MTELAVLVPVLNRPQNVKPLVESFLAGCPEDSFIWFLCSTGDDAEWDAVMAERQKYDMERIVVSMGGYAGEGTWPAKINLGTEVQGVDWYLFAADDVEFRPGWWEATKELRDDPSIGVIGTNDSSTGSGNPRVAAGEHTCHPLVRAEYIREFGTIDQRNLAVHPEYHHWCVDDELVWTAKLRSAWAFCREAVIEHNHPYWKPGEVPWDETYALGEANNNADLALWRYRAEHVLGLTIQ